MFASFICFEIAVTEMTRSYFPICS